MFAEPGTYDEVITVFSPDGRLFQVEYALETVYRGPTIIGVSCPEGVVIGAEEKVESRLRDPNFSEKIYEVDEHLGGAIVGLGSDARVLIDCARIYAQSNRLMYDEPADVEIVARGIGDLMQLYTQYEGVRPFGVSIIFAGVDKVGSRLFTTDPSGSYRAYRAVAIGIGHETAQNLLEKEYREDLKLDEAVKLAVKCLVKARIEKSTVRIAVIPSETKRFRMLTAEEVKPYMRRTSRIDKRERRL
ncbi:MAG: archaeal proteasome endopeptidase complex subunit alpha [Candidatus Bathyarchaeota archaeon]|nr:archaeal proteasome endopeptidase complex subunit alpha [Candidatus Bathyarchaeota archaeon]